MFFLYNNFLFNFPAAPSSSTNIGSQRKNHPLFHETIRWKSDVPLTEGQLRSKRGKHLGFANNLC